MASFMIQCLTRNLLQKSLLSHHLVKVLLQLLLLNLHGTLADHPNVVIFVVDDLGYGDLGAYGNTTLPTPNIDKLASQGVKLTQHLATASVCTPSRAALLTGRYPVRYGMTAYSLNRVILFAASRSGLPQSEVTFAQILRKHGYQTGLVGKWHLGLSANYKDDLLHHPNSHGFDYFYGTPMTNFKDSGGDGSSVVKSNYPNFIAFTVTGIIIGLSLAWLLCYFGQWPKTALVFALITILLFGGTWLFVNSMVRLNLFLMRNGTVIEQPIHFPTLTDRLTNEAIEFIIKSSSKPEQPFLLMFTFLKVHSAHFPSEKFLGKSNFGKYGDCVMEMDYAVGRVLSTIESLGLTNSTLIYFTSDNGGHIEEVNANGVQEGGYNGILPGGKSHGAVEGGIRVPGIISWPNHIPNNQSIDYPTSQMDLLPTLIDILDIQHPYSDRILDGQSILSLVTQDNWFKPRILFHYCGVYLHGVRYAESPGAVYKLYYYTPNYDKPEEKKCNFICQCFGSFVIAHDPPIIYNVAIDPAEKSPLPTNQTLVNFIDRQISKHKSTLDPDVESQFTPSLFMWRPWLQPCCGAPFCSCSEFELQYDGTSKLPTIQSS